MNIAVRETIAKNGAPYYYRVDLKAIPESEYQDLIEESPEITHKRLGYGGIYAYYREKLVRISKKEYDGFAPPQEEPSPRNDAKREGDQKDYATVYVFWGPDPDDYAYEDNDEVYDEMYDISSRLRDGEFTPEELTEWVERFNPEYMESARDGDLLEVAKLAGYRSQGVYMFAREPDENEKPYIIDLDYEWDDYGGPNKRFKFPQYTPFYWDDEKMERMNGSTSYWHSPADEYLAVYVDPNADAEWYGARGTPYYGVYGDYIVFLKAALGKSSGIKPTRVKKKAIPPEAISVYMPDRKLLTEKRGPKDFMEAVVLANPGKEFYQDHTIAL